jgi:hypothetical protein
MGDCKLFNWPTGRSEFGGSKIEDVQQALQHIYRQTKQRDGRKQKVKKKRVH